MIRHPTIADRRSDPAPVLLLLLLVATASLASCTGPTVATGDETVAAGVLWDDVLGSDGRFLEASPLQFPVTEGFGGLAFTGFDVPLFDWFYGTGGGVTAGLDAGLDRLIEPTAFDRARPLIEFAHDDVPAIALPTPAPPAGPSALSLAVAPPFAAFEAGQLPDALVPYVAVAFLLAILFVPAGCSLVARVVLARAPDSQPRGPPGGSSDSRPGQF